MWENDVGLSDEDYTNGMRWERHAYPECSRDALGPLGRGITRLHEFLSVGEFTRTVGYGFGMNLYTPRRTNISAPILVDRPYSGWAYGSLIASGQREREIAGLGTGLPEIDSTVEIMLGALGSWARQDRVQRAFHELMESDLPMGWEHQQEGAVGFNLLYNRERHFYRRNSNVRLSLGYGGILGNVRSEVNAKLAFAYANDARAWQFVDTDTIPSAVPALAARAVQGDRDPPEDRRCREGDYQCVKGEFLSLKYWSFALSGVPRYKAYDYFIEHDSAAGEHGIEIDRGAIDVVTSFEFKRPRSQSVFAFRYVMRSQELASPVDELNEEHRFFQFNWQSFFH